MVRLMGSHGKREIQVRSDAADERSNESDSGTVVFRAAEYSGPIPPPELIEGYQQAIPKGGERVFELAEREQHHRHAIERQQLANVSKAHSRGQAFAFALSLIIVVAGALLIADGKDIAGYGTLLVGGGALLRATFRKRSHG
jgi:uncharacterized membrane protein